jgi:Rieske 2Fe-2S family protein
LGRDFSGGREVALASARVAVWGGFVFVSFAEEPEPIIAALGEVPPAFARLELALLARAFRSEHEIAANWKVCVENFQESHHFPDVHPALEALTPSAQAESLLGDGPWLGGVMPLADGVETVSLDGRRHGRPALPGATPSDARRVRDYFLWPNALFSAQPDYLLCYRLWPLAVDRTRVTFDVLVHPETISRDVSELEPVRAFWARVNAEDAAICARQQRGMASRGFRPIGYDPREDGVLAFDRLLAKRYLGE